MAANYHPCDHHNGGGAASCHGSCCCSSACSSCHGYHLSTPDFHLHPPPPPVCHSHLDSDTCHLPKSRQYCDHFRDPYVREGRQNYPTVSALLRRIAVLESALRSRSSPSSAGLSLRDAAARRIQAQFRIFLLRRSRTLGQLKDLAAIKSSLGVLKSSVSENPHFDFEVIFRRALNLQLRLDDIQGVDPLIRNGRSALSRELNKFLDFLDSISVDNVLRTRGVDVWYERNNGKSGHTSHERNANFDDARKFNLRKLRTLGIKEQCEELDKIPLEYAIRKDGILVNRNRGSGAAKQQGGVKHGAKKHVTFADDGKVYRVVRIERDSGADKKREVEDDPFSRIEEIRVFPKEANEDDVDDDDDEEEEEEIESELENSGNGSDAEKESRNYNEKQSDGTRRVIQS